MSTKAETSSRAEMWRLECEKARAESNDLRVEVERLKGELDAETASADAEHANLVRVADKYRAREDDIVRALAAERQARELLGALLDAKDSDEYINAIAAGRAFLAPAPGTPEPATTKETDHGG